MGSMEKNRNEGFAGMAMDAARTLLVFVITAMMVITPMLSQAPVAKAQKNGKELIAVLPVTAVGASEVQASALTDRLQEELLRTGKYTLVDRSQMNAILEEQALQQTGCTDQECAVQVGQVLGVRKIVTGKATKLSDKLWLISGTMTDVETAATESAESVQLQGDFSVVLTQGAGVLAAKMAGVEPPASANIVSADGGGGGMPWWAWAAIGVGVLALAAAGGGGDSGGAKKDSCPSTSGCGSVTVTW